MKTHKDKARYWRRMAYYLSTRKQRIELFGEPIDELFFKKYNYEKKRMEKCNHKWNKDGYCLKCDNHKIKGYKLKD